MSNDDKLARRGSAQLAPGSYADPRVINAMLDSAGEYNLVAPATSCGNLPDGFEVAITVVRVVPDDAYNVGTKDKPSYGLPKAALDQIGSALGVVADPTLSGRTDDGSDPRYYAYRWVGHVQNFDGTWRTIVGEKEMDLRDGSPQVTAIIDRVEANNRKYGTNKSPDGQIRDMRLFIQAHAETKARLRALRSMGIKTSYRPAEIRRPFAVARLMATGRSSDPELRREFARMQFAAGLGAQARLFGAPKTDAPPAAPALRAPPPVDQGAIEPDDMVPFVAPVPHHPDLVQAHGESRDAPSEPRHERASSPGEHVIPGGNAKGTPLSEASDRDLSYWESRISADLSAGKARNPERDRALLDALRAELTVRGGAEY